MFLSSVGVLPLYGGASLSFRANGRRDILSCCRCVAGTDTYSDHTLEHLKEIVKSDDDEDTLFVLFNLAHEKAVEVLEKKKAEDDKKAKVGDKKTVKKVVKKETDKKKGE